MTRAQRLVADIERSPAILDIRVAEWHPDDSLAVLVDALRERIPLVALVGSRSPVNVDGRLLDAALTLAGPATDCHAANCLIDLADTFTRHPTAIGDWRERFARTLRERLVALDTAAIARLAPERALILLRIATGAAPFTDEFELRVAAVLLLTDRIAADPNLDSDRWVVNALVTESRRTKSWVLRAAIDEYVGRVKS